MIRELPFTALVILFLAALYYLLRLPTADLQLAFYDDGETLYHTLSWLAGRIPHRDDYNHHFSGYLLEFLLGAKFFGISIYLIRQVAFVNQVLMAFGVYLCLRLFTSRMHALLGASLAISAREPWIVGFYVQHQINLLAMFLLFCSLKSQRAPYWLAPAFLLSGVAFLFDQRALALLLIPLSSLILVQRSERSVGLKIAIYGVCAFLFAPVLGLGYLSAHSALIPFFEQTFLFPTKYRIGSADIFEGLLQGILIHKYLIYKTPVLLCTGLSGFIALLARHKNPENNREFFVLLCSAIPLLIMPFCGGRDYDYYSLTWLPFLAIISVLGGKIFFSNHRAAQIIYRTLLAAPVAIAIGSAVLVLERQILPYRGDGVRETVEYLAKHLREEETVFVWGYRLEIYVRLKHLSPYPFANRIMVHPDPLIEGRESRTKHIFPKYEREFLKLLSEKPPTYLVRFERGEIQSQYSPAEEAVNKMTAERYQLSFQIRKNDITGTECRFWVYRILSG